MENSLVLRQEPHEAAIVAEVGGPASVEEPLALPIHDEGTIDQSTNPEEMIRKLSWQLLRDEFIATADDFRQQANPQQKSVAEKEETVQAIPVQQAVEILEDFGLLTRQDLDEIMSSQSTEAMNGHAINPTNGLDFSIDDGKDRVIGQPLQSDRCNDFTLAADTPLLTEDKIDSLIDQLSDAGYRDGYVECGVAVLPLQQALDILQTSLRRQQQQ